MTGISTYAYAYNAPTTHVDLYGLAPGYLPGKMTTEAGGIQGNALAGVGNAIATGLSGGPSANAYRQKQQNNDPVSSSNVQGTDGRKHRIGQQDIAESYTVDRIVGVPAYGYWTVHLSNGQRYYNSGLSRRRRKQIRNFVGESLTFVERHFNGNLGVVSAAVGGYGKVPNDVKRHYAHKLSKQTGIKSGKIFQSVKAFSNGASKIASKVGPVGTFLTMGVIGYELGANTWDAHTVVNIGLLVGAGAAATLSAPAVLTGIAVYGVADYAFDLSGKIDANVGRKSDLWKP